MAPARASTLSGSTRSPAVPTSSGSAVRSELTTGVPHAIASISGSPNPSKSDG